jgi:hypothetical protein
MSPLDENSNLKYLGADKLTGIHVYEEKTTHKKYIESNGTLIGLEESLSMISHINEYITKTFQIDIKDINTEVEPELTPEEKQLALKQFQANCKHDKGYITGNGPSYCGICGKPWI